VRNVATTVTDNHSRNHCHSLITTLATATSTSTPAACRLWLSVAVAGIVATTLCGCGCMNLGCIWLWLPVLAAVVEAAAVCKPAPQNLILFNNCGWLGREIVSRLDFSDQEKEEKRRRGEEEKRRRGEEEKRRG